MDILLVLVLQLLAVPVLSVRLTLYGFQLFLLVKLSKVSKINIKKNNLTDLNEYIRYHH